MDLTPRQLAITRDILKQHVPEFEVRAFGSRVNGNAKPQSDLDLALIADEPISANKMALLKEAFSESDLPFKVDIVEWRTASDGFKAIINAGFESIQ